MADHDIEPDPIDAAYLRAEAMLDDNDARVARRARLLQAVADEPAAAPVARSPRVGRWGGWLTAAGIAGLGVLVASRVYQPPRQAPVEPASQAAVSKSTAAAQDASGSPAPPPPLVPASPPRPASVIAPAPPLRPQVAPPPPPPAEAAPAPVAAPPPPPLELPPAPKASPAPAPAAPPAVGEVAVTAQRRARAAEPEASSLAGNWRSTGFTLSIAQGGARMGGARICGAYEVAAQPGGPVDDGDLAAWRFEPGPSHSWRVHFRLSGGAGGEAVIRLDGDRMDWTLLAGSPPAAPPALRPPDRATLTRQPADPSRQPACGD
jgi:hypothetical protein